MIKLKKKAKPDPLLIRAIPCVDEPTRVELHFQYNKFLISEIKYHPGYAWNGTFWTVPRDVLELFLIPKFETEGYIVEYNPIVPEIILPEGLPFQKNGVNRTATLGTHLFAFETGLGKTKTAIDVCKAVHARRVIFVTVTKGIDDIAVEFNRWWPECTIRDYPYGFSTNEYEVLLAPWSTIHKYPPLSCDVLIFDEIEAAKNYTSKRGEAAIALRAKNFDAYFIGLSATPVPEGIVDYYGVFNLIAPGLFGGYWQFANAYGEIISNEYASKLVGRNPLRMDELNKRLAYWTLHQSKKGLPVPAINTQQIVIPSGVQDITSLTELNEKQIQAYLAKYQFDKVLTALPKIIDILDNRRHTHQVVLTWKIDTAKRIVKELEAEFDQPIILLTGELSIAKRKAAIKMAANMPECIIVASMKSIAEAINTLVFCDNIVIAELLYEARVYTQVLGRFCRLNSPFKDIYVTFILLDGTIEMDIAARVARKFEDTTQAIGTGTADETALSGLGSQENPEDFASRLGSLEYWDLGDFALDDTV